MLGAFLHDWRAIGGIQGSERYLRQRRGIARLCRSRRIVLEVAKMAEKRKTKTSSAVKNRYNNRVYGSIIVRVPKEMAEAFKENAPQQVRRKHKLSRKRLNSSWQNKRNNGGWQDLPPFFFWRKEERECTSI